MHLHDVLLLLVFMLLISEQDGGVRANIMLRPQDTICSCYCPSVANSFTSLCSLAYSKALPEKLSWYLCASKSALDRRLRQA